MSALDECPLCDHGKSFCGARDARNYSCTREPNHSGSHMACGSCEGHHPIRTWPQTPMVDDKDRDYWYRVAEEFQTKYLSLRTACEALVAAYNDDPAMPWREVQAIEELLK
jgi:hypothetical protein